MRSADQQRVLATAAGGLLLLLLWLALRWSSLDAPAPMTSPVGAGVQGGGALGAVLPAVPHTAAAEVGNGRQRVEVLHGVHGVLLDSSGEPVASHTDVLPLHWVALEREADDGSWQRLETTAVRGDGARFQWQPPGPGRYSVTAADGACRSEPFDVVARELHQVELRLPAARVVVELRFERDGKIVKGTSALLRRGGVEVLALDPDADGLLTAALVPGLYSVMARERRLSNQGHWLSFGEFPLTVPTGRARAALALPVGGADLEVRIQDENGRPVSHAIVELSGCTAAEDEAMTLRSGSGDGNLVRWPRLPAGLWQVAVRGERLIADELPSLTIAPLDRELVHTVMVQRAVVVKLRLHDHTGKSLRPSQAPMPRLQTSRGELQCERVASRGTLRTTLFCYRAVVHGLATLEAHDRQVDGEWCMLPFDAVPEEPLQIDGHADVEVVLEVTPRAWVDVRACDRGGRERFAATLQLLRDGVPVRACVAEPKQRWIGYLPPGNYVAVVQDGDQRFERDVAVSRRDLQVRLRL